MTQEFLTKIHFLDELATEESYRTMDVIETSLEAISEGIFDTRTISIAISSSKLSYYEMLDRVKDMLTSMIGKLMSLLNNMFINNVKLYERYRNLVYEGLKRRGSAVVHESYEWPDSRSYPQIIGASLNERDIQQLGQDITNQRYTSGDIAYRVDRLLEKFCKDVTGGYPELDDIKGSVQSIVTKRVRGCRTTVAIGIHNVDRYLKELGDYRKEREDLQKLERAVKDDYEKLKTTYEHISKDPLKAAEAQRRDMKYLQDPDMEDFNAQQYSRYADIHVQTMRLFNGYLDIYAESFATKLKLLEEKYLDTRNLIITIFTETGTLPTANRATGTSMKPIQYDPRLNGLMKR